MSTFLADYEDERQAFGDLLQADACNRILLFQGASGCGKTALLRHCLEKTPTDTPHVRYDFKGETPVAEVFHRAGQRLTWDRLPGLTSQVAQMQETPTTQIDKNWLAGINNRISVALHSENRLDREDRRAVLTNAFFDDLQGFDRSVMLVFDTFEKAPTEVQEWIGGPVLARAANFDKIRVVIAGQMVPDHNNIEWGHCCHKRDLFGVIDALHWLPVIEAMGHIIPHEPPLTWLAGVCHALNGRPADIVKIIEGLPKAEMPS